MVKPDPKRALTPRQKALLAGLCLHGNVLRLIEGRGVFLFLNGHLAKALSLDWAYGFSMLTIRCLVRDGLLICGRGFASFILSDAGRRRYDASRVVW